MPQQEDIFAAFVLEPDFDKVIFDEFDNDTVMYFLLIADERYHNSDQPVVSDTIYDNIYRRAKIADPTNKYFIGVGSDVRGGKVKLPYPMGSLNQKYENDVQKWIISKELPNHNFIITDKLDGVSALTIFRGDVTSKLQIAFSRGNGTEGADISRHLSKIVPENFQGQQVSTVIRGEVILTKDGFEALKTKVTSRTGEPYKNARNMVAGLMNAKENDPIVYDYLCFVAYEIIGDEQLSKQEMLNQLTEYGFLTPKWSKWKGLELTDKQLTTYIQDRKQRGDYEIDGVVIDVDNVLERQNLNPTKETLNPEYSFKYKITDESNMVTTTVTGIEFSVSKHGYLKPVIKIEPVELVGATVSKCTGFNAKFISDNKLGPGAKVIITRSGDVIPHIIQVVKPMPVENMHPESEYMTWLMKQFDTFGEWELTKNDVDVVLLDIDDNEDVIINRLISFFDKIDAPYLGEGNITKLFDDGYETPEIIINLSKEKLVEILGKNGEKVHQGLFEQLNPIPWYKLIGAHSKQRGIGVRKMKKLQTTLGDEFLQHNLDDFLNVDGFDMKTANRAVAAIISFQQFWTKVEHCVTIEDITPSGNKFENKKVVFSGFRDAESQFAVEREGGTMATSVSSKTDLVVTIDPNSNTGKVKKARDLGIEIISVEDLFLLLHA